MSLSWSEQLNNNWTRRKNTEDLSAASMTSFGVFKLKDKNLSDTAGTLWRAEGLQLLKPNVPAMYVTNKRIQAVPNTAQLCLIIVS